MTASPANVVCFGFCRVQLNLFLCCPFGDYEIDLIVESYSDEGSELQQRTAWEIENGSDEVLPHSSVTNKSKRKQKASL